MWSSRTGTRRTALLACALLVAACSGGPVQAPSASEPTLPTDTSNESPRPAQPADPEAPDVLTSGLRIVAGWSPYAVFAAGFNPWLADPTMSVLEWAERLVPARPTPDGATRIEVDVTVESEPGACFAFIRPVTAVRVDVAGDAGRAIERTLTTVAAARADMVEDFLSDEDGSWCAERFGGEPVGFHVVEVHGEPCELPDGPALVCATVGTLGYYLGTRESWSGETFVFDATTGKRITGEQLLAPYDPNLLDDLFDRIRAEVPIPHLTWVDWTPDLRPGPDGVDIVPSAEGLTWRWSPYTNLVGGIDLVVPWDVLEAVRTVREGGAG
jgi:hypothetical protein